MSIISLTSENFEQEVLSSDVPVLIDFWADWCGPCKMLAPIVEEVASEIEGVKIAKVDISSEPDLAKKYRIMSIPTLALIKEGKVVKTSVGLVSKEEVVALANS